MAENISSNSNESFNEAEKNELQIETKRAQYYLSVLEQEIHMLQQELSEISRESEEWNNQFFKTSNKIFNKIKQQDEIRDIIIYIQEWAEIDTDNSFLYKLRDLNTKLEAGESLEIKKLIQIKEALILESSNLRAKIESEITINKLKEILDGGMSFSWSISKQKSEEFTDLLIKSIISKKWVNWIQEQSTESPLDIAKKDFYTILVSTFKMLPPNEVSDFRKIWISITLQWTPELFWANDDHYLDIIEIIGSEDNVLKNHKEKMIENLENYEKEKPEIEKIAIQKEKEMQQEERIQKEIEKDKVVVSTYKHNPEVIILRKVAGWNSIDKAVDLLGEIEGFIQNPYWDYKQWSWGYGTKVPDEIVAKIPESVQKKAKEKIAVNGKKVLKKLSQRTATGVWKITKEQAHKDKLSHVQPLNTKLLKEEWFQNKNENQQAALLVALYNIWTWNLKTWTNLYYRLRKWSDRSIVNILKEYRKAWGSVLPGLVKRRGQEAKLYMTPVEIPESTAFAMVKQWNTLWPIIRELIKELDPNIKKIPTASHINWEIWNIGEITLLQLWQILSLTKEWDEYHLNINWDSYSHTIDSDWGIRKYWNVKSASIY